MADVFISYARADRERVEHIVDGLEANGFSVWWDSSAQGGGPPDREAETHLAEAACVVVAWSGASINRRWVRNHARHGVERGVFVPVRLSQVTPPAEFRDLPTEDLIGWAGDTSDPNWQSFVAAVHAIAAPDEAASDSPSGEAPSSKTQKHRRNRRSSGGGLYRLSIGLGIIGLLVAGFVLLAG